MPRLDGRTNSECTCQQPTSTATRNWQQHATSSNTQLAATRNWQQHATSSNTQLAATPQQQLARLLGSSLGVHLQPRRRPAACSPNPATTVAMYCCTCCRAHPQPNPQPRVARGPGEDVPQQLTARREAHGTESTTQSAQLQLQQLLSHPLRQQQLSADLRQCSAHLCRQHRVNHWRERDPSAPWRGLCTRQQQGISKVSARQQQGSSIGLWTPACS